jgi:hypothetical protein
MNKILAIFLKLFRNNAHYEYMVVFRDLILTFAIVKVLIADWFDTFIAQLGKEETLLDATQKSVFTQQIADADKRVDNTVIGLKAAINSNLYGFEPDKKLAAQILKNRIQTIKKITANSYEDESGGLHKLIIDFEGDYAEHIQKLGLTDWVVELKAAEEDFNQLMQLRHAERSNKLPDNLKDVRAEIDITYHNIINVINAAATIDTAGEYDEFIKQLNTQIKYFNEHATHRKTKKDISETVAETVPPQKYTEKPIIVIPTLKDEEGKELVFTVDFSVKYKNNTKIGNAKIIIAGKGNYKGVKEIGFDIVK